MDIDKMVEKVAEAVSSYGPKVGELAMQTAQLSVIRDLIVGGLWLLMGVVSATVAIWLLRLVFKIGAKVDGYGQIENVDGWAIAIIGCGVTTALSIVFMTATVFRLTNPILWASLSSPEVYLAAKALGWL